MSFVPIQSLLKSSLQKSKLYSHVEAVAVLKKFNEIVDKMFGKEIRERVKALYVKRGTLTVACVSSAAAQELKIKERKIIENINQMMNKKIVFKLRFVL